jgi:hypothetical protein
MVKNRVVIFVNKYRPLYRPSAFVRLYKLLLFIHLNRKFS